MKSDSEKRRNIRNAKENAAEPMDTMNGMNTAGNAGNAGNANTVDAAAMAVAVRKTPNRLRAVATGQTFKRIFTAVVCFIVTLLSAGVEAFPGTYPFGIAIVAAAGGMAMLVPAFAGAVVGSSAIPAAGGAYALVISLLCAVRLVTSAWIASDRLPEWMRSRGGRYKMKKKLDALYRAGNTNDEDGYGNGTVGHVLRFMLMLCSNADGTMLRESVTVRMALSALAALASGAWSVVKGGFTYYDLFGAVFSMLFTPVVTYIIYAATDRSMRATPLREVGIYALCTLFTYSLSALGSTRAAVGGVINSPFNAGIMFAFGVSAVLSIEWGVHRGAVAGFCCGMVMAPELLPMYPIAAVVARGLSSINGVSRGIAIASAGVSALAWAILKSGFSGAVAVLPPVAIACAVLIPLYRYRLIRLPETMLGGIRRASVSGEVAVMAADALERRVSGMAGSLKSVSEILYGLSKRLCSPGRAEGYMICERAFGLYCAGCGMRQKCAEKCVPSVIDEMVRELLSDGVVRASAVPGAMASRCYNIGRIIDKINYDMGELISAMRAGDKLSVTAGDMELAGEMMDAACSVRSSVAEIDAELSKKLRRLLSYNDFQAASVTVYGGRKKTIYVRGIDLTTTRLGGDDIRKLFERAAGRRLSQPEFSLDGDVLSMKLESVNQFSCESGKAVCAASDVHKYWSDTRGHGADCAEPDAAEHESRSNGSNGSKKAAVCGDVIISFEFDGKYYMIISDGMGSGREAALTSGICVSLLRRLIEAGAGLDAALKLLNGIIRQSGMECSTTVDIAEIDMIAGEARFIKSGAAPSFILRGGSIFRLQSKTVPIGIIRALDAEMIKFTIESGDRIVMVSDGAARSYDEVPWLLELLSTDDCVLHGRPGDAAERILEESAKRSADDVTVGVIEVE